ncbi:MAG: hypothetical protein AAF598_12585, partial [Bacteroidota bacterium]
MTTFLLFLCTLLAPTNHLDKAPELIKITAQKKKAAVKFFYGKAKDATVLHYYLEGKVVYLDVWERGSITFKARKMDKLIEFKTSKEGKFTKLDERSRKLI